MEVLSRAQDSPLAKCVNAIFIKFLNSVHFVRIYKSAWQSESVCTRISPCTQYEHVNEHVKRTEFKLISSAY